MRLQRVSQDRTCDGGAHIQDKDAESDANTTRAVANGGKIDNQDADPETGLERVHDEELGRLERIAQDEEDGEHIDQEHHDHEEDEDDNRTTSCQCMRMRAGKAMSAYPMAGCVKSSRSWTDRSASE